MKELVYEECDYELVKSSHSDEGIYYRLFWGTVNWSRSADGKYAAFTILMQYGNTVDFKAARNEIKTKMPAHILKEDIPKVQLATQRLLDRVKD
jgi:hypothetical protein